MNPQIQAELNRLAEPDYAAFQKKLMPDTHYPLLGVRMHHLRNMAKKAAKENWHQFQNFQYAYYEQVLLSGLVIGYAKVPFSEKGLKLWQLLPHLDTWALTDSIAATLKPKEEEMAEAFEFSLACISDDRVYVRRFGIVMMLNYYLMPDYIPKVLTTILLLDDERYYVGMASAWLLAELAARDLDVVMPLLQNSKLNTFVHNNTIRKMRESYKIPEETKDSIRNLKRKEM